MSHPTPDKKRDDLDDLHLSNKRKRAIELNDDDEEEDDASSDDGKRSTTPNSDDSPKITWAWRHGGAMVARRWRGEEAAEEAEEAGREHVAMWIVMGGRVADA